MDTCGVKVWLPGITDSKTLKMASELCDQVGYRLKDQEHESMHDVMTPGMIRELPAQRALVVRGGLSAVIAYLPMAWKDRLYKRARRQGWASFPATARASWDASVLLRNTGQEEMTEPVPAAVASAPTPAESEPGYSWTAGPR
jgi:hypothetical protein